MTVRNGVEIPVEGSKYVLDGRPEITVVVDAVYEEEHAVDARLVIRLPADSEFIQVQFFRNDDGYSDDFFQLTYRESNGRVSSRTFRLLPEGQDALTVLDGTWTLAEVIHVFIDKHSK